MGKIIMRILNLSRTYTLAKHNNRCRPPHQPLTRRLTKYVLTSKYLSLTHTHTHTHVTERRLDHPKRVILIMNRFGGGYIQINQPH